MVSKALRWSPLLATGAAFAAHADPDGGRSDQAKFSCDANGEDAHDGRRLCPDDWEPSRQSYCCDNHGSGCQSSLPSACALARGAASTLEDYDCQADALDWQTVWSPAKQRHCCRRYQIGCSRSGPPAPTVYDCFTRPSSTWSAVKQDWCCRTSSRGCPTTTQTWDCNLDVSTWQHSWCVEKRTFCCQSEKLGCHITTATPYDCDSGFDTWQVYWSLAKQAFCCQTSQRGCTTTTVTTTLSFDCNADLVHWMRSWSTQKKEWCCPRLEGGCPVGSTTVLPTAATTSLPFDCQAGTSNWLMGWSPEKQAYCCLSSGVGCSTTQPFDCRVGYTKWEITWTISKQSYCCQQASRGCPQVTSTSTLPFDCDQDFANWEKGWSSAKKGWCCTYRQRGCHSHHDSVKQKVYVIVPPGPAPSPAPCVNCDRPVPQPVPVPVPVPAPGPPVPVPRPVPVPNPVPVPYPVPVPAPAPTTPQATITFTSTTVTTTTVTTTSLIWIPTTVPPPPPTLPPTFPPSTPLPITTPLPPPSTCPAWVSGMVCNLNCYTPTSATPVALPGSTGSGTDVGIVDLTLDECRAACRDFLGCDAIVHTATGKGKCYGKKDIHTSAAEGGCQTQKPYITEMVCGAPWGKCTLLGDPHITPFDRKMLGSYPDSTGEFYMVPINTYSHGEYKVVESTAVTIHGRFGYTSLFTSAASTLGIAATGPLLGGHTLAVAFVGPTPQTPAYKGWKVTWDDQVVLAQYPSAYDSPDGTLHATFGPKEPTDFAVRARSTIGTAPGMHPSYVFELGAARTVQIYVLPGDELCNVVITMQKQEGQDGLCGNFNCNWSDDSKDELKKRGLYTTVGFAGSLFPSSLDSPAGWDTRTGPSPEEVMENCPASVKQSAGCLGTKAEIDACLFDACVEAGGQVLRKFSLSQVLPESGGAWWTSGLIQKAAAVASMAACALVLVMVPGMRPTVWSVRRASAEGYTRVALVDSDGERDAYLL